ncbi:MAG TPA: hypothetical protein VFI65_33590 [Streptosporangiaceae bacterium]|nr:hypothetical protein [Streptosporangiaceae bacterium]
MLPLRAADEPPAVPLRAEPARVDEPALVGPALEALLLLVPLRAVLPLRVVAAFEEAGVRAVDERLAPLGAEPLRELEVPEPPGGRPDPPEERGRPAAPFVGRDAPLGARVAMINTVIKHRAMPKHRYIRRVAPTRYAPHPPPIALGPVTGRARGPD